MSWFDRLLVTFMPLVPRPIVKWVSQSYVAGDHRWQMIEAVKNLNAQGASATVDLLGEFITDISQAHETARRYKGILERLDQENVSAGVSVKLTALGLLIDKDTCYDLVKDIVAEAQKVGRFVRLDMEDSPCTTDTIDVYLKLRRKYDNVGIVLQAYMRRTLGDVRHIIAAGAGDFRICKGIYIEPREVAFKDPDIVNKNYALVLEEMIKGKAMVGIATHDEKLVWEALRLIDRYQLKPNQYEFQMLLGVDEPLRQILINGGHRVRVYVPFGKQWYGYCSRRLKENPKIAGYVFKQFIGKLLGKNKTSASQQNAQQTLSDQRDLAQAT